MHEHHNVVIVGAGQGGLSVSYYLTKNAVPHILLDRGGVAHAWKAHRWDSFCLVTPNWSVDLPGLPYSGPDPSGFMPRDEFVAYMQRWADGFGAPVRAGVEVQRIGPHGNRFELLTNNGTITANAVIVATATYQHPRIPKVASGIPSSIHQVHAEDYKSPEQCPEGAVLIVGSGQTGCQLVEDMLRAGRPVYLCVGRTGRLPRRYRGRDCLEWQRDMGLLDRTPDMLESPAERFLGDPHLTGRDGGGTVSLHDYAKRGVHLLGRLEGVDGNTMRFGDNLQDDMRYADEFSDDLMRRIDDHIAAAQINAPPPTDAELAGGPEAAEWSVETVDKLTFSAAGIRTVIWATGFTYDFSWIDYPVTDEMGYPVTQDGATEIDGLYFCGLNWMTKRKSGILYGVKDDAENVARLVQRQLSEDGVVAGGVV
ncbi:MAG: NAD(P)-binding domain-containing protein [Alphaproteobacteria bacterium]|nr:NAD(P)-binding domain-containing protein [Alphaproteobacteria bacterium]